MSNPTHSITDKSELYEIVKDIRRANEVGIDAHGDIYAYIAGPKDGMGQHYDETNINISRDFQALIEQQCKLAYGRGKLESINRVKEWADKVEITYNDMMLEQISDVKAQAKETEKE